MGNLEGLSQAGPKSLTFWRFSHFVVPSETCDSALRTETFTPVAVHAKSTLFAPF